MSTSFKCDLVRLGRLGKYVAQRCGKSVRQFAFLCPSHKYVCLTRQQDTFLVRLAAYLSTTETIRYQRVVIMPIPRCVEVSYRIPCERKINSPAIAMVQPKGLWIFPHLSWPKVLFPRIVIMTPSETPVCLGPSVVSVHALRS